MKITSVETKLVICTSRNWNKNFATNRKEYAPGVVSTRKRLFIKIDTDEGVSGMFVGDGEVCQADKVHFIAKNLLIGEDPLAREKIWQHIWFCHSLFNISEHTLALIDVALWDLAGKYFGLPVYKLIGSYRNKVPAYASTADGDDNGGLDSPEAYADFAEECQKRGFTAFKIHPWGEPKRDAEACRAVRERVGDDMILMLDPYSRYSLNDAIWVGKQIEKLNFYWFESPLNEYSFYALAKLKEAVKVPILVPESVTGHLYSAAEYIIRKIADFVRVGVWDRGGLTPFLKTVALAEAFGLSAEPHGGGAATLHGMCATMNTGYYEFGLLHPKVPEDRSIADFWDIYGEKLTENYREGYVYVSENLGLGEEINWDKLEGEVETSK